ncbi:AraC family transcriptional regulator [Cohnella sp. REN36]|uniref:helix-turn-helix transcriptional regulator n=1 Tax=Cohnella sp. REN36 TaxID=2887347 RepID=UPI001D134C0F|nr:AraC family transcriptional regulator [Cohnella sp. REN36]MCC3375388.1 AraC family transcriptional regulator [Cohnella sp. REN36]
MEEASVVIRSPVLLGGQIFECSKERPFSLQMHKHDQMSEMLFVDRGGGVFGIDGRTYEATAGTLLLYHRGVWHEEQSTVYPFRALYVGFRGLALRGMPPDFFLAPGTAPVLPLGDRADAFARELGACIREAADVGPESRNIANHLLGALLGRLARDVHGKTAAAASRKPGRAAVLTAMRYMEEHYDRPITLDSLARLAYVNAYHLAHLFKEETGASPIQFLIGCRMEAAKRYLALGILSVREIAERVGYQSETTFQRTFKRHTGLTPGQYRDSGRNRD